MYPVINKTRYYGLSRLTCDKEQRLYQRIYQAVLAGERGVRLDGANPSTAERLFQVVLCDHPELYWASFSWQVGGWPSSLTFDFCGAVCRSAQIDYELNLAVGKILGRLPASDSQYDLAKAAYSVVAGQVEYGESAVTPDGPAYGRAHSCVGCLIDHRAVCEGIAEALQLVLQRAGITAFLVLGEASGTRTVDGGPHAWLLVSVDGSFYYMDPTLGGCSVSGFRPSFAFFLMSDDDVSARYQPESPVALPTCSGESGGYFTREGLLLDAWEEGTLAHVIEGQLSRGRAIVELQLADSESYAQAKRDVSDGQIAGRAVSVAASRADIPTDGSFSYCCIDDMRVVGLKVGRVEKDT